MKKGDIAMLDGQPSIDMKPVVKELIRIKQLLALILLRDGAAQQQVARAAGVATDTINQLARSGGVAKKNQNGKVKRV